jgi:hypothetical protein
MPDVQYGAVAPALKQLAAKRVAPTGAPASRRTPVKAAPAPVAATPVGKARREDLAKARQARLAKREKRTQQACKAGGSPKQRYGLKRSQQNLPWVARLREKCGVAIGKVTGLFALIVRALITFHATVAGAVRRKQGQPVSAAFSLFAVYSLLRLMENPLFTGSPTNALEHTAASFGISEGLMCKMLAHFETTGGLGYATVTSGRGTAHPAHPLRIVGVPPGEVAAVIAALQTSLGQFVRMRLDNGERTVVADLVEKARDEYAGKSWVASLNHRFIVRVMRAMGYTYGPVGSENLSRMNAEERHAVFRRFMLMLDKALKEETAGTAIIIYLDESYVYDTHHSRWGWFFAGGDGELADRGDFPKKGKRIIIMHAFTKDGLLSAVDDEHAPVEVKAFSTVAPTAEGIFRDTIGTHKDYHKSITAPLFNAWVKNRLIPAIKAKYPGKKAYVVMDNAAYHHQRADGFFNPKASGVSKAAILTWLTKTRKLTQLSFTKPAKTAGEPVRNITLDLTQPTVLADLTTKNGTKHNDLPTRAQLEDIAETHVMQLYGANSARTQVQQLLATAGMVPIYQYPYGSKCNPIETVWGMCKNYVAGVYKRGRSVETVIQQLRYSLYSKYKLRWRVGNTEATAVVRRCQRDVNEILARNFDATLASYGTIGNFVYGADVKAEVAAWMTGSVPLPLGMEGAVAAEDDTDEARGDAGEDTGEVDVEIIYEEDDGDAAGVGFVPPMYGAGGGPAEGAGTGLAAVDGEDEYDEAADSDFEPGAGEEEEDDDALWVANVVGESDGDGSDSDDKMDMV